ncbi:MAG: hypothetical protein JWM68_314 [Verrucomicrobiales bacterium]|nr:hypothetical protein [Verrucomicrobiales bacterium]
MKSKAKQNTKQPSRTTKATKKKAPTIPVQHQHRPPGRAQMRRMGIIYSEIASGKFPNRRTLSELIRASESTIKRDMQIMEMDYHIKYDKKKHGYHFDGPVSDAKGLPVTRREMIAALFLMQGMEQFQGTCWEAAIESICEKIAGDFPDMVTFQPSDWSKIMSARSNGKTVVTPENLEKIVSGIQDRETLHVTNYNQKGEVSERDLDPLHIQVFEDNLYLIAHDHKNNKVLTFGAWRIDPIARTGRKFVIPAGFNSDSHFEGSLGIYSEKDAIPRDIVIGFSKKVAVMIQERRWNGQQKIEKMPDGTVNLHLRLKGLLEVSRLILRWGPDVVDIQPDELLEMYGCYLQQMNANYTAILLKQAERRKAKAEAPADAVSAESDTANGPANNNAINSNQTANAQPDHANNPTAPQP